MQAHIDPHWTSFCGKCRHSLTQKRITWSVPSNQAEALGEGHFLFIFLFFWFILCSLTYHGRPLRVCFYPSLYLSDLLLMHSQIRLQGKKTQAVRSLDRRRISDTFQLKNELRSFSGSFRDGKMKLTKVLGLCLSTHNSEAPVWDELLGSSSAALGFFLGKICDDDWPDSGSLEQPKLSKLGVIQKFCFWKKKKMKIFHQLHCHVANRTAQLSRNMTNLQFFRRVFQWFTGSTNFHTSANQLRMERKK